MRKAFILVVTYLVSCAAVWAQPNSITVVTDNQPASDMLMQALTEGDDGPSVRRVIANDCVDLSEALRQVYSANGQDGDSALIVAGRCSATLGVASDVSQDMAASIPTVVISNTFMPSEDAIPDNFLILDVPTANPQIRANVQKQTGADLGTGHAGFCDAPTFFDSKSVGPAWVCIERADGILRDQHWAGTIGMTAKALVMGHPNFGSATAATPFGSLDNPWERDAFTVPGSTILNVDHWTLENNILRQRIPNDDLFDFLCPDCSGSGYICGDECPDSCKGNCSERNGKQCCRGDGSVAPLDFQ